MSRLISRDPFARHELHRSRVSTPYGCAWCGQGKQNPKGGKFLFKYRLESDSGQTSPISGQFCSIDCMRSYHQ